MARAFIRNADDLAYEEDVLRNPYSLRSWWRYLEWKIDAPFKERATLFERALQELPGSYKLWHKYLQERLVVAKLYPPDHAVWASLNTAYERALVLLHKMPRLWLEFQDALILQRQVTRTRKCFDRALRALPVTQHDRVWAKYLDWIKKLRSPETAIRVYRRYLKFRPADAEQYIEFLLEHGNHTEAARQLLGCLNNPRFASAAGRSRQQLWLQLCDIVSKHPTDAVEGLNVDAMIRSGLRSMPEEKGRLWCALADFYARQALFDKARDIFEEGLADITMVKDFSQIWDSYIQFEDTMLSQLMQLADAADGKDAALDEEVEMLMAHYEALVDRRPLLLNSVMLRQNPHNVREWHKRVRLQSDGAKKVATFQEALRTVDVEKAHGKAFTLWCAFAQLYERNEDYAAARAIYERAIQAPHRTADDLASVFCGYAEMEIRLNEPARAQEVLARATNKPIGIVGPIEMQPPHKRVFKVLRIWQLRIDVEEAVGTFESTRALYERVIDLKIATAQLVLNYAQWLEETKHFEDSFRAYERGIALFDWPYVSDLWLMYLHKFISRYGGRKLERARDLFEQALEKVPRDEAKLFFMLYAQMEEEHSLARHAMLVYERACKKVAEPDRLGMYRIFIQRAAELFGVTRTREIYEHAIANVQGEAVRELCLQYANMERRLSEIDRARAIFTHGAQTCDPREAANHRFWDKWKEFEVRHGSEETYRDMLRVKRSIQAKYTSESMAAQEMKAVAHRVDAAIQRRVRMHEAADNHNLAILETASQTGGYVPGLGNIQGRAGHEGPRAIGEAPRTKGGRGGRRGATGGASDGGGASGMHIGGGGGSAAAAAAAAPSNPDEISVDMDDDAAPSTSTPAVVSSAAGGNVVKQRVVPATLFGALADQAAAQAAADAAADKAADATAATAPSDEPTAPGMLGALERFKRKKL